MSILSSVTFALKRLWSHRGLAFCLVVGIVTAVALAVAVPLYADGINYHQLNTALTQTAAQSRRSPFTFIFHYVGAWHEPIELEEYQPVDTFMTEQIAGVIGLPLSDNSNGVIRYVSTDNLPLYPEGDHIDRTLRLDLVKLAFVSGIFEHVQLVDGQLPGEDPLPGQEVQGVEVLVPLKMANQLGLNAGDAYMLYKANEFESEPFRLQVRVSGIWQPIDPQDEFWFYSPESFDNRMLVAESAFFTNATKNLPQPINEAVWRITFDGRSINSEEVPGLLSRVGKAQILVNSLLPNTDLEDSPMQALRQYRRDSLALTSLLFFFSAPVLGLVFYFLGLVTAMLVRRQRNEIAILRSRGASRGWVVMIYALEWSLLGLVVLLAGPRIGMAMANLFGQTQSFLDFSRLSEWPVRLTAQTAGFGAAVITFAVFFSIIPVWQAGRFTIVSFKLERARANQRPFWQRAYLDVLVILPAVYGLYTLRDKDSGGWLGGGNPFENPVLFLLPTFFILGSSLLLLRVLPIILSSLDWLISHLPGTVPILVFRQLSRSAGMHMAPLMLMVITLSLAGFVASMAHTLDSSMSDHVYYQVGADLNLVEGGEYTGEPPPQSIGTGFPGITNAGQSQTVADESAVWNFLPVSDHLALPGVQAVTRVGHYNGRLEAGGNVVNGDLVGLDRSDFPAVAFFRRDFASESLGALMNRLAADPSALLVDRDTWERMNLNIGDHVKVGVRIGERFDLDFRVAGVVDYFPTLYPGEDAFFLANLEYIFESIGGLQPYDVWLRTNPDADTQAIIRGVNQLGVAVIRVLDARLVLDQTFTSPNRQGMLGLLSIGFLTAVLLTVIGFLLYALLSFRERFIQLGVVRAIGLSVRQMSAYLALEQLVLILIGVGLGTGIAVLTASLFIPHMPVVFDGHAGTPPFVVEIAWGDIARVYAIFAGMLVLGIVSTVFSLRRMKVFQVVKMGESI